jgi:hypothetical protein
VRRFIDLVPNPFRKNNNEENGWYQRIPQGEDLDNNQTAPTNRSLYTVLIVVPLSIY